MKCKNCPYIKDEYDIKASYEEANGLIADEYDDYLYRECQCDKIGGKIGYFGFCGDTNKTDNYVEDTYLPFIYPSTKLKSYKRYLTNLSYKNKLKRQAKSNLGYPSPSYGVDRQGNWTDNDADVLYYKKCYKSKHASRFKYYKNQSSRKVRRNKDLVLKGGEYKKFYEYQWNIW